MQPVIRKAANLQGKTLVFRDASVEDADFIYSLRTDPSRSAFLSRLEGGVAAQEQWLARYRQGSGEAYFIISTPDRPIGTVRLYDARDCSFGWGSWILVDGAPRNAAIESALMVYAYAIDCLGFQKAHFKVNRENGRVCEFHERFGAQVLSADDLENHYEIDFSAIARSRMKYNRYLPQGTFRCPQ